MKSTSPLSRGLPPHVSNVAGAFMLKPQEQWLLSEANSAAGSSLTDKKEKEQPDPHAKFAAQKQAFHHTTQHPLTPLFTPE